jgi:replicative DNA helicase
MDQLIRQGNLDVCALSSIWKDRVDFIRAQADGLTPDHFADTDLAELFTRTATALSKPEIAADPAMTPFEAVMGDCYRHGFGQMTPQRMIDVDNIEPTSVRCKTYVRALLANGHAKAMQAKLSAAAKRIEVEGASAIDEVRMEVAKAAMAEVASEDRQHTLSDAAAKAVEAIDNPVPRVGTGIAGFDRVAGGIAQHELVILGGRPGQGKSALALQIARHFAARIPVAFFSLEMPEAEIAERCALQALGFDGTGSHPKAVAKRRAWLAEQAQRRSRLHLFDAPPYTVATIRARAEEIARRPAGLGLIVVDYLQLLTPPAFMKNANREQHVASMSRELKLIAMNLRVPVLALAQLSRGAEKEEREPKLSDLRESGAIEQDADRVWFIHSSMEGHAIMQRKCRGGPSGVGTRLAFNSACLSFSEVDAMPR